MKKTKRQSRSAAPLAAFYDKGHRAPGEMLLLQFCSNPGLRQDFTALHLAQPESWPAYFRLGNRDLIGWSSRSRINSDDRTLLEYTAPRHLLRRAFTSELTDRVRSAEQQPFSASFPTEDVSRLAIASAATAFESNSDQALRFLEAVPSGDTTPAVAVRRARSKLKSGDAAGAAEELAPFASTASNQSEVKYWLAVAQRAQGLLSVADATLPRVPARESRLRGRLARQGGHRQRLERLAEQTRLTSLRSDAAPERCRLGELLLRSRRFAEAEAPLRSGLGLDPYAFLCHRELGELERATGRTSEAIRELEWVARYFPEADARTYASLAWAYEAVGRQAKAEAALAKGRRLFPGDSLLQDLNLK